MATYHNNTSFTPELIGSLPLIGRTVNEWRRRVIDLYAHPTDPTRLVSVGTACDGSMTVVADEPRDAWATALDYIAHGKVYTSR